MGVNQRGFFPFISGGDKVVGGDISRSDFIDSQESNGFEESIVVLDSVLANDQVSDNQNGSLTKEVIFGLVVGDAKSFRGNNGFEFSVFVEGDLVVSTVGEDLSKSSLLSVVAFHLLSGIVVRESSIKESKVTKTNQESRRDDVFSISTIVNQSVLFFESVTGFNNSEDVFVVNNEVNVVVLSIKDEGNSVKVTLRVSRFSSDQRNGVQESSIFGDGVNHSTVFVKDLGNARSVRKSHISGFSSTRGQFLLARISFSEEILFLEALPAVVEQPEAIFVVVLGVLDGFDLIGIDLGDFVSLVKISVSQPVIDLSLGLLGFFFPVKEFLPVGQSSSSHAFLPGGKVGIISKVVLVESVSLEAVSQGSFAFRVRFLAVIPRDTSRKDGGRESTSDVEDLEDGSNASRPSQSINRQSPIDTP
jgi:hypothetical protein